MAQVEMRAGLRRLRAAFRFLMRFTHTAISQSRRTVRAVGTTGY
jgi:hypothetical protein